MYKKVLQRITENVLEFKAQPVKRYLNNLRKRFKNGLENLKNRGLEGVWEVLGATLARKICQKLSWPDLGRFWLGSDR